MKSCGFSHRFTIVLNRYSKHREMFLHSDACPCRACSKNCKGWARVGIFKASRG